MNKITIQVEVDSEELKFPVNFNEGDRLFYEIGYFKELDENNLWVGWTHTGKFREIKNPLEFIDSENRWYEECNGKTFIQHHNFRIIKKGTIGNEKQSII